MQNTVAAVSGNSYGPAMAWQRSESFVDIFRL